MKPRPKVLIHRVLQSAGLDLVRVDHMPRTLLEIGMAGIHTAKSPIRIVQIGANDGVFGDPLNRFVTAHRHDAQCLFVEPQSEPLEILRNHHASASEFTYVNAAVGPPGTLRLYSVRREAWGEIAAAYSSGWPEYRAPTGITSSDRQHVELWLRKYYKGRAHVDDLICPLEVPCAPLTDILADSGWDSDIDVLQIDTEGSDDHVLFESSIEEIQPILINFERIHLTPERLKRCVDYLAALGYECLNTGNDILAVRGLR